MIPRIDAGTRLVALLGNPVSHSLSPVIQNAAFRAAGVPGVYLALRTESASLGEMMRAIAVGGGAGNVTVPHKQAAVAVLDRATDAVRRTGACNTFWVAAGEIWGDNTDVHGFRAAAASLLGRPPRGARVLLIGAGGAARAVLAALEDDSADEVVVLNRSSDRAAALLSFFDGGPLRLRLAAAAEALDPAGFDLVVNATSLGLRPDDPLPIPTETVGDAAALDLVYSPGGTPWTRALRRAGVPTADGTEMLIRQGAAAFERWWDRPAPIGAMRDALPDSA